MRYGDWYTGQMYDDSTEMGYPYDEPLDKPPGNRPPSNPMMYGRDRYMGEFPTISKPDKAPKMKAKETGKERTMTVKVPKGGPLAMYYPLEARQAVGRQGEMDLAKSQKLEAYAKMFGPAFTSDIQHDYVSNKLKNVGTAHSYFSNYGRDAQDRALRKAEGIVASQEREKEAAEILEMKKELDRMAAQGIPIGTIGSGQQGIRDAYNRLRGKR